MKVIDILNPQIIISPDGHTIWIKDKDEGKILVKFKDVDGIHIYDHRGTNIGEY